VEYSINVHGETYTIQSITQPHLDLSRINQYAEILSAFQRHSAPLSMDLSSVVEVFSTHYLSLVSRFSTSGIERIAIDAAGDFQTPTDAIDHDLFTFLEAPSMELFITQSQALSKTQGISKARFAETFSSDCPDYPRALQIAVSGVIIDPPANFIPISTHSEHRAVVERMPHVIQKLVHKLWLEDKGLYLPLKYLDSNSGVHINPIHWVAKPTNPLGRFLIDATDASSSNISLNGPGAKESSIQRYGRIQHPLIQDIITDWFLHMAIHNHSLSDMFLWKEDIEGCFPQMPLHHSAAKLSTVLLPNDVLFITTMGYLGASVMGMAWDSIGRCLDWSIKGSIKGTLHRYCDDFMGFGHISEVSHDQPLVKNVCRRAIGDGAINDTKSVTPTQQAIILG
jgi:hypothetical protein